MQFEDYYVTDPKYTNFSIESVGYEFTLGVGLIGYVWQTGTYKWYKNFILLNL